MQSVADPNPNPFRSLTNRLPSSPATRYSMSGNARRSQAQSHPTDNASGLPSVVDESEQVAENHRHNIDILKYVSPDAVRKLQAMGSQVDAFNPTQRISQSFYDSLLRKSKSTQPGEEQSTSQRTYEEGEDGHVDITSSFVTRHEHHEPSDDLADSEPVDFSPVQSQHLLTQFPESQRFKTPATAGKKRTHTGDIIETPAPVRNPLIRGENATSNGMFGLSQAFAATQAASSPFSDGLPTGPRSDRPSPNIELQLQHATASSSSPLLRPMTELQRAATEPAARYVSVKQSQAERERQERLQMLKVVNGIDDLDYDFDEEDSAMARRRRQRAREEKAKQELKSLSSPLLPPQDFSSTSPLKTTHDLSEDHIPDISTASPTATDDMEVEDIMVALASEAETEQETADQINVTRSSQTRKFSEENKENNSILVPKTGLRDRLYIEQEIGQIDASPLLRRSTAKSVLPMNMDMQSSEPFRVMDSQPSQSGSKSLGSGRVNTNTISDIIDFVEQSTHANTLKATESTRLSENELDPHMISNAGKGKVRWPEDEVETNIPDSELSVNIANRDTVPETSSDIRAGISNKESVVEQHGNANKDSTVVTGNDFETAPTHIGQANTFQSSQISSPIRTTPPGRKRRRLLEISAEPSPRKSQSQMSFDAEAVLQLDDDVEAADLLESSPTRRTPLPKSALSKESVAAEQSDIPIPLPKVPSLSVSEFVASRQGQDSSIGGTKFTPETSQEVIRPGRQGRLPRPSEEPAEQPTSSAELPIISRRSIFDIQASPEKQPVNKLKVKIPVASSKIKQRRGRENTQNTSRMDKRLQTNGISHQISHDDLGHGHESIRSTDQSDILEVRDSDVRYDVLADGIIAPHMILAYYKGDPRGYYPAKLLGRTSSSGYTIQWEGYEPDEVDAHGVKALDLRVGDAIKVLADGFQKIPYTIKGFKDKAQSVGDVVTDIRGYQTLIVTQKQRKGRPNGTSVESPCEISVASIYLDVNMWAQMKSRNQEFRPLSASTTVTGMVTPLDRTSSPTTPSSKGRRQTLPVVQVSTPIMHGMFLNMAFAISYDDPTQKNMYNNHVQANGGMIINDSFHDLLEPDRVQLKAPHAHVGFTALLTDRHSRKEKYMQALALGLPCLSGRWIEACVKQNKLLNWQSYLLPAGESVELANATRSRVLPPIDMMNSKLSGLLESRPNLLEDAPVVVVVGRGKAEAKRAPYLFLIRAIGASQIHRVPDIESAKELLASNEGMPFKWVFVDDKDVKAMRHLLEGGGDNKPNKPRAKARGRINDNRSRCTVAGNELIVQSLILGRLYDSH